MLPRTIVCQPPNQVGLGHIARLLAIATAVRDAAPDVRLPFIVEGHGHGLVQAAGFPHLTVPGRFEIHERWTCWNAHEKETVITTLADALLRGLSPDLILFDCFPNPHIARAGLALGVPLGICLRKAKDMRPFFAGIRAAGSAVRVVLVAHDEGECEIPADIAPLARFTGQIMRPGLPSSAPRTDDDGSRLVVITGGGGGYPGTVAFYNLALDAFARLRARQPDVAGLLVAGPLFEDWWQLRLVDGLRVMPFDAGLSTTCARASLVLCQGGYNTVAELVARGVPTICVPAERGADDQFARARQFARITPTFEAWEGTNAGLLAERMARALRAERTAVTAPASSTAATAEALPSAMRAADGAAVAARCLLDVIGRSAPASSSKV